MCIIASAFPQCKTSQPNTKTTGTWDITLKGTMQGQA